MIGYLLMWRRSLAAALLFSACNSSGSHVSDSASGSVGSASTSTSSTVPTSSDSHPDSLTSTTSGGGNGLTSGNNSTTNSSTIGNDETTSESSDSRPFCGDGHVDSGEQCDDGNQIMYDGCNTRCQISIGVKQVTPSVEFTCALLKNGKVTCFGGDFDGSLGLGDGDQTGTMPQDGMFVAFPGDANITQIAATWRHICALDEAGKVYCWGANPFGQLGDGTNNTTKQAPGEPIAIKGNLKATHIAAGMYHTCAILEDNSVRCWGYGAYGQLGTGNVEDILIPNTDVNFAKYNNDSAPQKLVLGQQYSCALFANQTVSCWGWNFDPHKQAGYETNEVEDPQKGGLWLNPGPALDFGDVTFKVLDIDAGSLHTCVMSTDGRVRCWGNNQNGELGYGYKGGGQAILTQDVDFAGNVVRIASGALAADTMHTCVATQTGGVLAWGDGTRGQLGLGEKLDYLPAPPLTPAKFNAAEAVYVVAGLGDNACAIVGNADDFGGLRCWGYNPFGQLGLPDTVKIYGDDPGETLDQLADIPGL